MSPIFEDSYKTLNKAQKEAVDHIEGPVMVVAGPGTGKTQILALRIGNILKKTDTSPDGILCLTFTNSGVSAMRERLERYIGKDAEKVKISTFHSFAFELIEKNYGLLDFDELPVLLSDDEAVFLIDDILNSYDWEHISPRANPAMYFNDLKHLVSVLKRERISASDLLVYIKEDIERLENDESNISSRGESKGSLKKEVLKKIDQLKRTKELAKFYEIYEEKKKESSLIDYDDVLEYAITLVTNFESVRDDLRENYLYVLVDEHQDSSGIQNSFLKAVWQGVTDPNIFVVGDDRQLIYAFSGASLSYFEEFSHIFGKAKLIVLTENYRSTAPILSIADDLLKSSITNEKLNSNKKGEHKIMLNEYQYSRDEIIGAGLYFKQKIKEGVLASECALLVPKNYNVRQAVEILKAMDLPTSSDKNDSLFLNKKSDLLRLLLGVIANPLDSILLSKTILDKRSGILHLEAHNFLKKIDPSKLRIEDLILAGEPEGMFQSENTITKWGNKILNWVNTLNDQKPSVVISHIGNELLINQAENNDDLIDSIEIVRSFIHLATLFEQKHKKVDLKSFLDYLNRLESYNTHIEIAKLGQEKGVEVMTLHRSKGLEYQCVWIAHMNEETLMSGKRGGFSLPEKLEHHISKKDQETAKRELYVAITRAKEFCAISYANLNYSGGEMELVTSKTMSIELLGIS